MPQGLSLKRYLSERNLVVPIVEVNEPTSTAHKEDGIESDPEEGTELFQPASAQPVIELKNAISQRVAIAENKSKLHYITGLDRSAGLGGQRSMLLHPDYPLIQTLTAISTILLVYVAAVVQVEVGFYWHEGLCASQNGPLQSFDVFVDLFFKDPGHAMRINLPTQMPDPDHQ